MVNEQLEISKFEEIVNEYRGFKTLNFDQWIHKFDYRS